MNSNSRNKIYVTDTTIYHICRMNGLMLLLHDLYTHRFKIYENTQAYSKIGKEVLEVYNPLGEISKEKCLIGSTSMNINHDMW